MQFVWFWEARGAWISMESAHRTHHKHAKAPQIFCADAQSWPKAIQVILVAISGHDVEFWEVETQNFNFLKKMKFDSKAKFHPTTFNCYLTWRGWRHTWFLVLLRSHITTQLQRCLVSFVCHTKLFSEMQKKMVLQGGLLSCHQRPRICQLRFYQPQSCGKLTCSWSNTKLERPPCHTGH